MLVKVKQVFGPRDPFSGLEISDADKMGTLKTKFTRNYYSTHPPIRTIEWSLTTNLVKFLSLLGKSFRRMC